MIQHRGWFGLFLLQLMITTTVHSLPFTIVPQRPLPTTVHNGGQRDAAYIVTNNTNAARQANQVKWLPPNTTVGNDGCGYSFDLAPGASCILNLTISGPISAADPNPHHHLFVCFEGGKTCAGTSYPLNVKSISQQFSYVANQNVNGNNISICNPTFDTCVVQTDPSFSSPADVILNDDATIAYVANAVSGKISICPVKSEDGSFNPCRLSDVIYSVAPGYPGYPGLRIINNYLYASDYNASTVVICPVQPDGMLATCTTTNGNGTFVSPNGRVAFNHACTLAYVPYYWSTDSVSICHVNNLDGSLSGCVAHTDPALFKPMGAYMNPLGNYLYIANGADDSHIVICPVHGDGSLGSCTSVTDPTFALGDYQLNIFVSENQYLYVPNPSGNLDGTTLSVCPIQSNGLLGSCSAFTGGGTLHGPTSAWISFDP